MNHIKDIARGMCMGMADIVPGVSGATVAILLGIYERLIAALAGFNIQALRLLLKGQWKACAAQTDLFFLLRVFAGMVLTIVIVVKLLHFPELLARYPSYIYALFLA